MDVQTVSASRTAGQARAVGSPIPASASTEPRSLALRVGAVFAPHAGCSGTSVITVQALDEHGAPVTCYLHLSDELLATLGRPSRTAMVASRS